MKDELAAAVAREMPGLVDDLSALVRHASVAFPGFPSEPVMRAAESTIDILKRSGAKNARLLEVPDGYPAVYAEVEGPAGAPTVLLYAHYDVQPAPQEQGWESNPFEPVVRDGRLYGRGAADDKSGVILHAGALRAFGGKPPVNVRILIEGEEETHSHLEDFVRGHPDLVQADAIVVADSGNPRVGEPALTTALRGEASCRVKVKALDNALHSGMFGGAVPDALLAMIKTLSTLHDEQGSIAVQGLTEFEWTDGEVRESDLRANAGLRDEFQLIGTGAIASRLWSKPALSVIGMDVPSTAQASNIVLPEASVKLSLRVPPGADPRAEMNKVIDHLRSNVPWGLDLQADILGAGAPFTVDTTHDAIAAANEALTEVFSTPAGATGSGGSIPLVSALQELCPAAGIIMWGAEDTASARIHAANESVDLIELERMVVAQALLLAKLATRPGVSTGSNAALG